MAVEEISGAQGRYHDGKVVLPSKTKNPAESLVCSSCRLAIFSPDTFQRALSSRNLLGGHSYTANWDQVQISAEHNCHWCTLLLSANQDGKLRGESEVSVSFRLDTSESTTPRGVLILRLVLDGSPHSSYYVYTEFHDPAAAHVIARAPIHQVHPASARPLAVNCVSNCIANHPRCFGPQNSSVLPTRIIDCFDPGRPKLRLGNGENQLYVALSYVWGEAQPHCTTTERLEAYISGIDPSLLPQTIKDAIVWTHALGLRYLWVDSLCILQDSKDDKVREIARIRTIFQHSYTTLIAASAHQDRTSNRSQDVEFPFFCPDGQVGRMWLSPVWRQYDGSMEPVNQRAWCLEERLFSPRSLVFASHTLQFHCQTSIVNIGDSLPDVLLGADPELPLSQTESEILRWAWFDVVADYTRREVTKTGDKLLAFAAIAEAFHRCWSTDYLAGLWRATLVRDVLWCKDYENRLPRPDKRYRAPSWSWASVDGRVLPYLLDDRLNIARAEIKSCVILSCDVTLATATLPFGKVASGKLVIQTSMISAAWSPEEPQPKLKKLWPKESDHRPNPILIGDAYPDSVEDIHDIFAVPIIWNEREQYAAGLIITPLEGDKYRRVGCFHSPEEAPQGISWIVGETRVITIV
ncbi:HET-domain-containing protein [Mycena sanguinolenta]|nr:HET-domain-containing protein [Mycena sanguinolenta]